MRTLIILLVTTFIFSGSTLAATCLSLGNGDWNTPSTWSCGAVPVGGDIITIVAGHTVSISTVTNVVGAAVTINVDGILVFDTPGAKLNLPCGSIIIISATGSIQSTGIGQASHGIRICRNDVWIGTDGPLTGPLVIGTVLPIELTFFDAESYGAMVDFTWQTASEKDNNFFTIEGSIDGFSWNEMHRITGAGTTQEVQNYTYKSPNNDKNLYFRLKQTDFDGNFVYSDIVAIEIIRDELKVYPNPSNGAALNIDLPSKKSGTLQILNSDGRVAYSNVLGDSQDLHLTDLNLMPGTYFVQVQQKDQLFMERLIIQ